MIQGASASLVARVLGLRRTTNQGYAILGANSLGRLFASRLQEAGEEVVILDANEDSTREAQAQGLRVVFGNAMEERAMLSAQLESRRGIVGLLANPAQNLLFAQKGREQGGAPRAWIAIQRGPGAPEPGAILETGTHLLFSGTQDLELWSVRIRRELTRLEIWEWEKGRGSASEGDWRIPRKGRNQLLPLLLFRNGGHQLIDEETNLKTGDRVEWLVLADAKEAGHERLRDMGWMPGGEVPVASASEPHQA